MARPIALRALSAAAGALVVGGLASSAILAPGLPREGGTGHAVESALAVQASPLEPPRAHGRDEPSAAPAETPGPPPSEPGPAPPQPSWFATLGAATSYSASPGGPAAGTLPATNPFGGAETLGVVGQPGAGPWVQVQLPIRPNGTTGWVLREDVSLASTMYSVRVSIADRTLTVMDGNQVVLTTPAAVGSPGTPTPTGHTYLWELIRPDNPYGAYGPYIFGLAWYSDTYTWFNGGDAQIGIHGQDEPWSIGHAVSHGCVRLPNDVISTLSTMLPLGTPVTIG